MIQKIREEIEKMKGGLWINNPYDKRAISRLNRLLSFLDTLEEDRPEPYNPVYDEAYLNEKIAKASKSWKGVDVDAMLDECRGREKSEKPTFLESEVEKWMRDNSDDNGFFNQVELARHFARWGAEHAKGSSEIPNNHEGLDEAAEKYAGYDQDCEGAFYEPMIIQAFKAGAEWAFGQGESHETVVFEDENGTMFVEVFVKEPFKMADKVIVQIRRKN